MEKQRGIIIIGGGSDKLAIKRAREIAEKTNSTLLTTDEAIELGYKNIPEGVTEMPIFELTNPRVYDFEPKIYEITSGFSIPKKHNWKRNNKRN